MATSTFVTLALLGTASAFAPARPWTSPRAVRAGAAAGPASLDAPGALGRRGALGSAALALAGAAGLGPGSAALAMDAKKFENELRSYGVTDFKPCPSGFNPVLEFYGKALGARWVLASPGAPRGFSFSSLFPTTAQISCHMT